MDLSPEQTQLLREMLDVFTTDTLYTLLLGLDGSAALGGCLLYTSPSPRD